MLICIYFTNLSVEISSYFELIWGLRISINSFKVYYKISWWLSDTSKFTWETK